MRWHLKWREAVRSGQYYDLLAKGFFDGKPEDLEPDITGLSFYFDAFRDLGTCRPGGLDVQAIPFTAIVEYSRIYETGDLDEFIHVIRIMDDIFLDWNASENKRGKAGGPANADKKNNNKSGHARKP